MLTSCRYCHPRACLGQWIDTKNPCPLDFPLSQSIGQCLGGFFVVTGTYPDIPPRLLGPSLLSRSGTAAAEVLVQSQERCWQNRSSQELVFGKYVAGIPYISCLDMSGYMSGYVWIIYNWGRVDRVRFETSNQDGQGYGSIFQIPRTSEKWLLMEQIF